uniref:Uncharacterized protein n=1 Tax=Brugia timori TaxID=42155 RepID=A0A0R3QC52_9BILA
LLVYGFRDLNLSCFFAAFPFNRFAFSLYLLKS